MKLENMNVVTCPPCGESTLKGGKGVVKGNSLLDNPPSALRATSPAGGEVNGGFTLIELLVVVLIIGILAAVALPQYQKAVAKSRMATMLPVVKNIADALDVHYLQHGAYPTTDLDGLDISLPDDCTPVERQGYLTFACGSDFVLDMTNGVSRANYCPKKNTSWNDCKDSREFQIALIGIYFNDDRKGKKLCTVQNNSNIGKQICSNLAGFECSGC